MIALLQKKVSWRASSISKECWEVREATIAAAVPQDPQSPNHRILDPHPAGRDYVRADSGPEQRSKQGLQAWDSRDLLAGARWGTSGGATEKGKGKSLMEPLTPQEGYSPLRR